MFAEIGTQSRRIGRVELVNAGRGRGGACRYKGAYSNQDGAFIEFEVVHRRDDGALRLLEMAFRRARTAVDEFYSYPKGKVRHGLLKASDVPERYREAFGKWLGIATCSELDGELAFNVGDVAGFLDNRRNGFVPLWD